MTIATRMSCWATAAAVGLAAALMPLAGVTTPEITGTDPDPRLGGTERHLDVYLDPDIGDILGDQVGGRTAPQLSTTTLILGRTRCDCPPRPRITFVGTVLRTNFPPSAGCVTPPGVPTFHPAGTEQGPRS